MSENRVPAGVPTGGQFAASTKGEAGLSLGAPECPRHGGPWGADETCEHCTTDDGQARPVDQPGPLGPGARVPLTARDVEHLRQNKGVFENGYDAADADRILSGFQSARLDVFWEYEDEYGFGGHSEFAGVPAGATNASLGDYRTIHPDVWHYLSDPDSDVDPATVPSLLANEPAGINTGEIYCFSVGMGTQWAYRVARSDDTCACCESRLDDGEGHDGYCGECADLIEQHNADEHTGGNRIDDCPNCSGANITWA